MLKLYKKAIAVFEPLFNLFNPSIDNYLICITDSQLFLALMAHILAEPNSTNAKEWGTLFVLDDPYLENIEKDIWFFNSAFLIVNGLAYESVFSRAKEFYNSIKFIKDYNKVDLAAYQKAAFVLLLMNCFADSAEMLPTNSVELFLHFFNNPYIPAEERAAGMNEFTKIAEIEIPGRLTKKSIANMKVAYLKFYKKTYYSTIDQ